MRIHHLSFSSIGPFNTPQHIDFEPLNDAGVFLFSGPTGAGKSTILDAITLALYGGPAVERGATVFAVVAKDADVLTYPPEVTLEFSTKQHRYRVHRSLAHTVPSKRAASGFANRPAKALLERVAKDGQFEVISTNVSEIGGEIENIIHLNRAQFTTVMMLPQGQFATFLSGSTKERGVILERLFGTQRFQTVMAALKEQATEASSHIDQQLQRLNALEDGICSSASEQFGWQKPEYESNFELQLSSIQQRAAQQREQLDEARIEAANAHEQQRRKLSEQEEDLSALQLHREYQQRKQMIQEQQESFILAQEQLAKHEAGSSVWTEHQLCQQAQKTVERAAGEHDEAEQKFKLHWQDELLNKDPETQSQQLAAVEQEQKQVQQALAAEKELKKLSLESTDFLAEVHKLKAEASTALMQEDSLQKLLDQNQQELEALGDTSSQLQLLEPHSAKWFELEIIRKAFTTAQKNYDSARQLFEQKSEECARARDHQLNLMRGQLQQAAQRLARELQPGEACQVCGSTEHPSPAIDVGESKELISEQQIKEATADYEKLYLQQQKLESEKTQSFETFSSARSKFRHQINDLLQDKADSIAGLDEQDPELEQLLARQKMSFEQKLSQVRKAESRSIELTQQLAELSQKLQKLTKQRQDNAVALAQKQTQLTTAKDRLEELTLYIEPWIKRSGSVKKAEQHLRIKIAVAHELLTARQNHENLSRDLVARQNEFNQILKKTIFTNVEQLEQTRLKPEQRTELTQLVQNHLSAKDRLEETVRSEKFQRAQLLVEENTDSDKLQQRLLQTQQRVEQTQKHLSETDQRRGRIQSYQEALARSAHEWFLLFEDLAENIETVKRIKHVAEVAAGGQGNDKKIPLNIFVLAAKLEHVVEEASKHLLTMSDGRYQLRYHDERVGNQLVGLGLKIYDDRSGTERETKTLSGGETFMASLALALGLADVVQQEAGGTSMETLFIDEGFGSLDADTLNDVMDTIQQLFDYGRVVGLVSHVDDMKQQIPAQLSVTPALSGSTVQITTGR